jgi:hypothetical protein
MKDDKVIITGSGQCGTTFLVDLLTELGFDTGYTPEQQGDPKGSREWTIRGEHARKERMPYILKNPRLCLDLLERAERWDWNIRHVYLLLRDYECVANNKNTRRGSARSPGKTKEESIEIYKTMASSFVGQAVLQVVKAELPYTFIMFPRSISDPKYLFEKLSFVLNGMSYETFLVGFNQIADPSKVHWREEEL